MFFIYGIVLREKIISFVFLVNVVKESRKMDAIRNKIVELYKLSVDFSKEMYVLSENFKEEKGKIYEKFMQENLIKRVTDYQIKAFFLINFFKKYVSINFTLRGLIMDLLSSIGLKHAYWSLLRGDVELDDEKVDILDEFFLKYQVRSTMDVLIPLTDGFFNYAPLEELRIAAESLDAKLPTKIMPCLEKQVNYWRKVEEEVKSLTEKAEAGGVEEAVNSLKRILKILFPLVKGMEEVTHCFTSRIAELVNGEEEADELIGKVYWEVESLIRDWRDVHKSAFNYLVAFLSMIGNSFDVGEETFKKAIVDEVDPEKVIPRELNVQDVAFAINQALSELEDAWLKASRMVERSVILFRVADVLESSFLRFISERLVTRFKVFEKYGKLILEKLQEIQAELGKMSETK